MHSMVVVWMGVDNDGPGESALRISATWSSRLSTAVVKDAPQSSQLNNEGWFWYVHLGHTVPPEDDTEIAAPFLLSFGGVTGPGRFEMAAIAAFTTCIVGGLMPQARHGGIGVRDASAGSKLEGTGFEKEQIGHIQDALIDGGGAGLFRRSGEPDAGLGAAGALNPRESWFAGLGKRVILGEDLRKPAYVRRQYPLSRAPMLDQTYIEVRLLYIFQEDGNRVLA